MHRVETMHMNIIRNAHATLKICMWQETCGMDDRSGNISHADEKTKGRTCRTCQFISGLSSWLALRKPLRSVPGQALLWHSSCDGGSLPPPHRRPAHLPQLRKRPRRCNHLGKTISETMPNSRIIDYYLIETRGSWWKQTLHSAA